MLKALLATVLMYHWIHLTTLPPATMQQSAWPHLHSTQTLRLLGSDGPHYRQNGLHFADNDQHRPLPFITRLGGMLYERLLNKEHPQGCWRRTTMQQYRALENDGDVVIDVGQVNAGWLLCGFWSLPPEHKKAIIQLCDVANSTYALLEWDLVTCMPAVHQAFRLTTSSPSQAPWLDENTVLLISSLNRGDDQTQAGGAGTVRIWERGNAGQDAQVLFTAASDHLMAKAFRNWGADHEVIVYVDVETTSRTVIYLGPRDGTYVGLSIPETSLWVIRGDQLAILLKEDWSLNENKYVAGTIVGVSMQQMFAGNPISVQLCNAIGFQDAFLDRTHLVILFCHNFQYYIRMFKPADGWSEVTALHLPPGEVISISPLDFYPGETDDTVLLTSQGPLTPPTFWTSSSHDGLKMLKEAPATFSTLWHSLSHDYITHSKGEQIPYTLVAPRFSTARQPVCLILCGPDMTPGYNTILGQQWLEPGGALVFLPGDYSDTSSSIQHATCVARHLIRTGVTVPSCIAVLGAYEHGAALIEMYPALEGVFAAIGSYNPHWSSEETFRVAGGRIQGHKGAQQHHLQISCSSSDPVDVDRARRIGKKLQTFDYNVNYYESDMGESGSREDAKFWLTLHLKIFSQKVGLFLETQTDIARCMSVD